MDAALLITVIIAIIIIALVVAIVWIALRASSKKRAAGPSRIELYFDENFRNLIDEWDLQSRSRVKEWRSEMTKRLSDVGNDVDRLKSFQRTMDSRIDRLKHDVVKLEKL